MTVLRKSVVGHRSWDLGHDWDLGYWLGSSSCDHDRFWTWMVTQTIGIWAVDLDLVVGIMIGSVDIVNSTFNQAI